MQNDRGGSPPASLHAAAIHSHLKVFAVIKQLFDQPIPDPAPIGPEFMPAGTEVLSNKMEEDFLKYSPVMWADPLLPYEIKVVEGDEVSGIMPAIGVDVNGSVDLSSPGLDLSAFGLQIKGLIDANVTQDGAIRSLLPSPGKLSSIATIMQKSDRDSTPLLDEAAVARLMLLQTATVDALQQAYVSSSMDMFAINVGVDKKSCKLTWTKALDSSDKLQIGIQESTSNLYFRTLDEYAAIISGNATDENCIMDKSKNRVNTSHIVFIPVKSCWSGQAWLMPYILSFTTTAWWNHAVTVDVIHTNLVAEKVSGVNLSARYMPKASTVFVPGRYQYICLVVIDSSRASFSNAHSLAICKGIAATREGNFNFAKQVHSYLGRINDKSVCEMATSHITQAMNHMCEFMATRNEFRRVQIKVAVLSTSRFNGYGVYPCPDKPGRADVKSEKERSHIFGPASFNNKDPIAVADCLLSDLLDMTAADLKNRMQAFKLWRTDPIGYMAFGSVNVKKDSTHTPCLYEYNTGCPQYQLSESSANLRILRACGIFVRESESNKHLYQKPVDVFNTTLAYGSLMLGIMNWAMVETGITIFEHNRLERRWKCVFDDYSNLWPTITGKFVIAFSEHVDRAIDDEKDKKLWGWLMGTNCLPNNVDVSWMDSHYSWNCPWWFVASIAEKFGVKLVVKTKPNCEFMEDEDSSTPNNMLVGWMIATQTSAQYDLSILTHSNQYESNVRKCFPAYFDILTPTSNGKSVAYNMISWNHNALTDAKKLQFRSRTKQNMPIFEGIVELNVVVFPAARMAKMNAWPYAFVSSDGRVQPQDEPTMPYVKGGLTWPNVCRDWLIKGVLIPWPPVYPLYSIPDSMTEKPSDSQLERGASAKDKRKEDLSCIERHSQEEQEDEHIWPETIDKPKTQNPSWGEGEREQG